MAARGINPAHGALKSGPRPSTEKRKIIGLMTRLLHNPLINTKQETNSKAYTPFYPRFISHTKIMTHLFLENLNRLKISAHFARIFKTFRQFYGKIN